MKTILFVNQPGNESTACGVYMIGMQYFNAFLSYSSYKFHLCYASSFNDVQLKIDEIHPDAIIFNFHNHTLHWANVIYFKQLHKNIPMIMLYHDGTDLFVQFYIPELHAGFDYVFIPNTTLSTSNVRKNFYVFDRIIPEGIPGKYEEKEIPVIGYQGFGFEHKGIEQLAQQVVREFDTAILRLHIPYSDVGDPEGHLSRARITAVEQIVKHKNIALEYSYELKSSQELIFWLSQNTINCYFYDDMPAYGVASAPDYAVAAKRPIAVRPTSQLKYIWHNVPTANVERYSLKEIMQQNFLPFQQLYNQMQPREVVKQVENHLDTIIQRHKERNEGSVL